MRLDFKLNLPMVVKPFLDRTRLLSAAFKSSSEAIKPFASYKSIHFHFKLGLTLALNEPTHVVNFNLHIFDAWFEFT